MATVLEQVRTQLARRRAAGATFDDAWAEVLPTAADWRATLAATVEAWRSAYEGQPAQASERALALVADPSDRDPLKTADRAKGCATCSQPIPATRRRHARYCSHACQRAAHGRRAIAA